MAIRGKTGLLSVPLAACVLSVLHPHVHSLRPHSSIFRVLEVARWGLVRLDMRFVDGDTYFPQSIAVKIPLCLYSAECLLDIEGATRILCRVKRLCIVYAGMYALRATTKSGGVEAGCCATVMRRAAPWPETSSSALCATEDKSSRHVRRVASRLSSPPLAPDTNAASAAH